MCSVLSKFTLLTSSAVKTWSEIILVTAIGIVSNHVTSNPFHAPKPGLCLLPSNTFGLKQNIHTSSALSANPAIRQYSQVFGVCHCVKDLPTVPYTQKQHLCATNETERGDRLVYVILLDRKFCYLLIAHYRKSSYRHKSIIPLAM